MTGSFGGKATLKTNFEGFSKRRVSQRRVDLSYMVILRMEIICNHVCIQTPTRWTVDK